jgi:hypothetical protein
VNTTRQELVARLEPLLRSFFDVAQRDGSSRAIEQASLELRAQLQRLDEYDEARALRDRTSRMWARVRSRMTARLALTLVVGHGACGVPRWSGYSRGCTLSGRWTFDGADGKWCKRHATVKRDAFVTAVVAAAYREVLGRDYDAYQPKMPTPEQSEAIAVKLGISIADPVPAGISS